MASRVPDALMYNRATSSMNRSRSNLISNQEKALSGKSINRPSDGPTQTMQALRIGHQMDRDQVINTNLETANTFLNFTDATLGELTEVLSRAKELSIQMSNSTNQNEGSLDAVGKEVEQLYTRLVQIGNTRVGDRYLFGGFQTDHPPFDMEGNYFGDSGTLEIEMDRGQRIAINVAGTSPFFGLKDIPAGGDQIRQDPSKGSVPTIGGQMRDPASIEAQQLGIDAKENPEGFAAIVDKAGVNLFDVFKNFSEGLKTNDIQALHRSIEGLDKGFKQVLGARAIVGARQNLLKLSQNTLEASQGSNAELKSRVEDADTLEVYSDMAKNENALKASLEMNKKILTPSLMDFLK